MHLLQVFHPGGMVTSGDDDILLPASFADGVEIFDLPNYVVSDFPPDFIGLS